MFEIAQNILSQATSQGQLPCAALAIGRGSEVLYKNIWGKSISVGGDENADMNTLFDMASLTKILSTTMVALRFIEDGKLCLYDHISDYFQTPKAKGDITVRNLMTHTSGIEAHIRLSQYCSTPEEAAQCILEYPLAAPTGTKVIYSCMGYILLGKILEQIGAKPLNELAREMVFEPLEMKNTGYLPKGTNIAATEYRESLGKCQRGVVHDENAGFLRGVSGNAGVFSDLDDMTKFCAMLSNHGRTSHGYFLSPATMSAATRNYTPWSLEGRGLGFMIHNEDFDFMGDVFPIGSFGHTGFTGTSIVIDPCSRLFVVLLTNRVHPTRDNIACNRIRRTVHNAVMAEYSKKFTD